jgi:hypothetical protein
MKNLSTLIMSLVLGGALAQPTAVDICLVTVSESMDHNIVVWDKPSDPNVIAVNVYREDLAGNFVLIATEAVANLSEYHDLTADPNLRAFSYKISSIDAGGNESVLSDPHRTIHVSSVEIAGIPKVIWTDYVGYPVDTYQCWRDSMSLLGNDDWQMVFTAPSSGDSTYAWNDNNAPDAAYFNYTSYKIDVTWTHSCEATRAVNHNTSRSNKTLGVQASSIKESTISEVAVYPNPASGQLNLVFSSTSWEPLSWQLIDATGKVVKMRDQLKVLGQYRESLDINGLSGGLYFVRIISPSETKVISVSILQ